MPDFNILDIVAFFWALTWWVGYTIFADASSHRRNSISAHMARNELSSSLVYGGQKEGWRILLIDHARSQPA